MTFESKTMSRPAVGARPAKGDARDRFVAFAFAGADVLIETDAAGEIVFAAGALGLFGCTPDDVIGQPMLDLCEDADRSVVQNLLERPERVSRHNARMISLCDGRGGTARFELMCGVFPEFGEHFFFSLCHAESPAKDSARDIADVTNVAQGDEFAAIAAERLSDLRAAGEQNEELTLLQLSGLETLRQRASRSKASQFLRETIEHLRRVAVSEESVGVLGTEEFGVIHHRDTPMDAIAAEIGGLSKALDPENRGVSVQHATMDLAAEGLSDNDALQALAFTLKEFAKSGITGSLSSLETAYSAMLDDTLGRIDAVRSLIAQRSYDIAYQPIVKLSDGTVHHHEALIRPRTGGRDQSPYELVTFAESVDLISEIDLAMCESLLQAKQTHGRPDQQIALNLSARSLQCATFNDALLGVLERHPGQPSSMIFEITETYEIADLNETNAKLQQLRTKGYRICLDDFGVGAANLKVLDALDIDFLKIDGLFVQALSKRPEALPLLKATAKLCRDLKIISIAEFVEDAETARILVEHGVDLAQGFYFGKPEIKFPDTNA